jgi:hypothetical protein
MTNPNKPLAQDELTAFREAEGIPVEPVIPDIVNFKLHDYRKDIKDEIDRVTEE